MKRVILIIATLALLGILLTSCGGSSNSNVPPSKIAKRALVSNAVFGVLQIIDYTRDVETTSNVIQAGSQPGMMVETPDHLKTVVFDSGSNTLGIVDNKTEAPIAGISLPEFSSSIVVSPDSKAAYAATRNAPATGLQNGAVQVVDVDKGTLGTQIPVALAKTLLLASDGKKMLVFSDNSDQISFISDVTATSPAPTPTPVIDNSGALSRPVAGVFSSDGTKVYVANCGPECGGSKPAGVAVIDMTQTPPVVLNTQPLTGASTILLDGTTLYVAGTAPGATQGSLAVLTATGDTLTPAKQDIKISLGLHTEIIKAADTKIFVGATGCPNVVTTPDQLAAGQIQGGCLSMYDTAAGDVTITNAANGFVTGMAAIPGRSVVYVVEGGELHIYNTKTRQIQVAPCPGPSCSIDIVGKAIDVIVIDE